MVAPCQDPGGISFPNRHRGEFENLRCSVLFEFWLGQYECFALGGVRSVPRSFQKRGSEGGSSQTGEGKDDPVGGKHEDKCKRRLPDLTAL